MGQKIKPVLCNCKPLLHDVEGETYFPSTGEYRCECYILTKLLEK